MKKIDDYFSSAKLIKDLSQTFSDDELLSLLQNSKPSKFRKFLKKFKGILIMTSIILSVLSFYFIGIYLFAGNIHNQAIGIKTEKAINSVKSQISSKQAATNELLSKNNLKIKAKNESQNQNFKQVHNQNNSKEQLNQNGISQNNSNNTRFATVDENHVLIRPYQIERNERFTTASGILLESGNDPALEPVTIQTDKKGNPIKGIIQIELTSNELAKLGIIVNDSLFSFNTEYYHQIHPIPYHNRYDYKICKDVKPYTDSGYLPNGDTFLVKQNHSVNLNYKYNPKIDKKLNGGFSATTTWAYKNIDGKDTWIQVDSVNHAQDTSLIGLTMDEVLNKIQKSYFGYNKSILNYTGWKKNEYSGSVPISFAFNYNPVKEKVSEIIYNSPLFNLEDNNWALDYSELLPVIINFGKNKLIEKAVLWFIPTNEFIDLLPERYSKSLKNEVSVLSGIKNGNINADSACSLIKDVSYLDVCRIKDGVIKIEKINPHPIRESAELSFMLEENRKITIDIHDLNGKPVGNFISNKFLEKGSHKLPLIFKNFPSGIYLIAIKSEFDEIATLRIIIN